MKYLPSILRYGIYLFKIWVSPTVQTLKLKSKAINGIISFRSFFPAYDNISFILGKEPL